MIWDGDEDLFEYFVVLFEVVVVELVDMGGVDGDVGVFFDVVGGCGGIVGLEWWC